MSLREKWLIAGIVVLVIIAAFVAKEALNAHDLQVKAEATQQAQKQVFDQAQQKIDQAQADAKQAQQALQDQLASIAKQRQAPPPTPQQVVIDVSKLLPNLPTPVTVQNTPTPVNPQEQSILVPQEDIKAFQNFKLDCDEKSANLTACSLQKASLQTQFDSSQAQEKATAQERDMWEHAAKGGSFWGRVGKKLKCIGITTGTAALGAYATKSHPYEGAAAGSIIGNIGCELL